MELSNQIFIDFNSDYDTSIERVDSPPRVVGTHPQQNIALSYINSFWACIPSRTWISSVQKWFQNFKKNYFWSYFGGLTFGGWLFGLGLTLRWLWVRKTFFWSEPVSLLFMCYNNGIVSFSWSDQFFPSLWGWFSGRVRTHHPGHQIIFETDITSKKLNDHQG